MPTVQLSLVGPSYQSRTTPLNAQVTRNFYPEPVKDGLSNAALLSWPGAKLFSQGASPNRGMLDEPWKGSVFVVSGSNLVKIDSSGARTNLGAIPGTSRCVMVAASFYIYIVTDGLVFRSDGTTVEAVNDEDLETPNSVAFLNSQLIYDGNEGRFVTSTPGDGSDIDSLNYATAESRPDDLIRVYAFNQVLYLMGATSGEPWYNSGVGSPPFDRIDGGLFHVGIAGVNAITNTDNALYFLGHDRSVYRLDGYSPIPVSTVAISGAIERYARVDDCFAYSLRLQGQSYVVFTFPEADKSWVYSETIGEWFEISSGVDGGRHLANGYCFAFGKHLISDHRNGNVLEWCLDSFTDNDETILRERVTQPYHGDSIGAPGKMLFWSRLELVINSGSGLVLGQGVDPLIMMQFSDDGGRTWSQEVRAPAGRLGAFQLKVEWHNLGASISRMYRFRMSDPVELHMFKLFADIEVGL